MNLAKNNYVPSKPHNTSFGGYVYNYDFDGYNSILDIASRIVTDWKFDEKCKKIGENYKKRKSHKKGN